MTRHNIRFGASGFGWLSREYAQYLNEMLKLKQEPMYFLYSLESATGKSSVTIHEVGL